MKRDTVFLFAVLTLLVWGLFAPDRGLFHDDAAQLSWAQAAAAHPLRGLFEPLGGPTRRLLGVPWLLAWASGTPALVLQALYGACWFATGWILFALVRALFPARRGVAVVAGALALTATSDFLTNAPEATGYSISAFAFLAALLAATRWLAGGPPRTLVFAAVLVNVGVFTTDGLAPAVALTPLFFLAVRGRLDRRVAVAAAAWGLSLVPWAVTFLRFLNDPTSYAAVALRPLGAAERARSTLAIVAHNFSPWRWVWSRPTWFDSPPSLVPPWLYAGAALAGTLLFVRAAFRADAASGDTWSADERGRAVRVGAVALLFLVTTNGAFAGVQFSDVFYRTHLISRVFASLALALATEELARRVPRAPRLTLLLPAVFVGLGVAGGVERQDFYLSTWHRNRNELSSILEEAPGLAPGTSLVLMMVESSPALQATRASYLAQSWAGLLYDDVGLIWRTFLFLPEYGSACRTEDAGMRCWRSNAERDAVARGVSPGLLLPWERLVVLVYDPAAWRYRLVPATPDSRPLYDPAARIVDARPAPRTRELLAGDRLLARLLPERPLDRR